MAVIGFDFAEEDDKSFMSFYRNGNIIESVEVTKHTNKEEVEGYIAHKWGLEDKLPFNHPYAPYPEDCVIILEEQ